MAPTRPEPAPRIIAELRCGRTRSVRGSCCLLVLIVSTSSCLAQHVAVADWGGEARFAGSRDPAWQTRPRRPYQKEKIFSQKRSSTRVTPALNRSEEHTSELQSRGHLVCRLLLE